MNNNLKLEARVKSAIFTKNNSNFIKSTKEVPSDSNNNPRKEDSRLSNFVRGFRRENTDFFPLTKRHSAVFESSPAPKQPQIHQRSSAIFQRNRDKGEPILTDFIPKRDLTLTGRPKVQQVQQMAMPNIAQRQSTPVPKNLDFLRREKTESVILVRNTAARQHMLNQQQVKDPRSTSFFVGRELITFFCFFDFKPNFPLDNLLTNWGWAWLLVYRIILKILLFLSVFCFYFCAWGEFTWLLMNFLFEN